MTLCEDCEHSHPTNKKRKAYRWMCMKFPRIEMDNFVTTDQRLSDPYMYCKDINGGICPLFKKEKGNQMEMIK
jgi:hypothetical protein